MTALAPPEAHDGRCGKRTRSGKPCTQVAGFGTDHVGEGACKFHGGATPIRHGRYSTIRRPEIRSLIEEHEADPDPLNVLPELAAARALFQDYVERYDEWREAVLAWHASYTPAMRPIDPELADALQDVLDELEAHIGPVPEKLEVRMEPEPQPHGGWLERHREDDEEDPDLRIHGAVRRVRKLLELLQEENATKPREILDLSDAIRHIDVISKVVDRIEKARNANAISRPHLFRLMAEMARVVEHYNQEADPDVRLQQIKDGWLSLRLP